ncbi:putative F-box protein PP2-B12 isoform X1 [Jatropha curcas]|uniref:putative F-box protein PP2-B12 isoform X1 n=1 Tax=Jatropha curcas TaxID=180498 RepID=UPI0009D7610E|nr:putative F-box protein PP2-B12 isoform X1 [Jatropha curcas]
MTVADQSLLYIYIGKIFAVKEKQVYLEMEMEGEGVGDMSILPESCVANVLSFTSPPDACRLSLISTIFKKAAESDTVWERFLPTDSQAIVFRSSQSSLLRSRISKKQLFFSLCDNPILIDDGKMSFGLDKWSGKKCYMVAPRLLTIAWGDSPQYWQWVSDPNSRSIHSFIDNKQKVGTSSRSLSKYKGLHGCRFAEVAEVSAVGWFDIKGKINISMLSPATLYKAYLVFKLTSRVSGFENRPIEALVGLVGSESCKRTVYLDNRNARNRNDHNHPNNRGDGWLEIELGEFLNKGEDDYGELEMGVLEVKRLYWKGGLVVQGIEIRPKEGQ